MPEKVSYKVVAYEQFHGGYEGHTRHVGEIGTDPSKWPVGLDSVLVEVTKPGGVKDHFWIHSPYDIETWEQLEFLVVVGLGEYGLELA